MVYGVQIADSFHMVWCTVIKCVYSIEKISWEAIITDKHVYETSYQVHMYRTVYSKGSVKEIEREEEGRCCVWV
jgi:hypothetical protein